MIGICVGVLITVAIQAAGFTFAAWMVRSSHQGRWRRGGW